MSDTDADGEEVRTWLVERSYDDRGLVTLVYATPDGERYVRREVAMNVLRRSPATAARAVEAEALAPTPEAERERYATEAARVRENNDPDDEI
jgi:hypothetical protein